ncbi:MAG: Molybdenum-pterin-binding protein MopA [Candidatus Celerinatantimonas neptuna]|nr:MAG: Molybdenum-pterin-binding protein MopA [Candidatus Celerinatantimonas neptuna]
MTTLLPLQLQVSGHPLFTEQRISLLEAIDKTGSLNAAAKSMPMSYKAAWDALDLMNNLAQEPLVIRQSGGRHGGGTQLTAAGRQLIQLYRALQLEYQQSLEKLQVVAQEQPDLDLLQLRRLLRQMHFRSSARNQFNGTVVSIRKKGVKSRVVIRIGESCAFDIEAAVTSEAVYELALEPGVEVLALIKAPQLKVSLPEQGSRRSANHYQGTVTRLSYDEQYCQVVIAIDSHKHLAVLMSRLRAERMALTEGQVVHVGFSPSSVVLCRYDE